MKCREVGASSFLLSERLLTLENRVSLRKNAYNGKILTFPFNYTSNINVLIILK